MDHPYDIPPSPDPLVEWREFHHKQEAEFTRARVKRKLAEAPETRAAQMPTQLRDLEDKLQREFNEQLAGIVRSVNDALVPVLTGLADRIERLERGQREATTVATAVGAVGRGFDRITAKLDRLERVHALEQVSGTARVINVNGGGGLN